MVTEGRIYGDVLEKVDVKEDGVVVLTNDVDVGHRVLGNNNKVVTQEAEDKEDVNGVDVA